MKSRLVIPRSTRRSTAPDEHDPFPPTSRDVPTLHPRGVCFRTQDEATWRALQVANGRNVNHGRATAIALATALLLLGTALLVALAR